MRVKRPLIVLLVGSPAAALVACSLILDTSNEQCSLDGDCVQRGFAGTTCQNHVCITGAGDVADAGPVDPTWGCLGNVPPGKGTKPKVTVQVPLLELVTKSPVTAVTASLCAKIDINCAMPLATSQPNAMGILTFQLDSGFDGYVTVTPNPPDAGAPDAAVDAGADHLVPSLVFFNPPIFDDLTYAPIIMVKGQTLIQLAQANSDVIDPTLGAVFMTALDCSLKPASDVAVTLDSTVSTTRGFYFAGGLPTLTGSSTDATGFTGFINTPTGSRTITGVLKTEQKAIGKVSVFTRASTISYTTMAPSP